MSWNYLHKGEIGPVLVCLHGVGGNATAFEPQLNGLSQHLQVWSVDLPGYGLSAALSTMDWESLVAGLKQFLDHHKLHQVHLLGHSFGGMLAQEFAARHPNYLASLILYSTSAAFGSKDGEFQQNFIAARLKPLNQGSSMQQLAGNLIDPLLAPHGSPHVRQAAIQCMQQVPSGTYSQAIECITTFDCRHNLPKLTMPTLLLAGAEDTVASPAMMQRMASKIGKATAVVIADAGHLANLEQAQIFDQQVAAFIAQCDYK